MSKDKEVSVSFYNFDNYQTDVLTRPRDEAWTNWAKFSEINDKVQGFIADVFYRPAEGEFKEQRGITLKQQSGEFINVGIKTLSFELAKTDKLHIGDPLTVVLEKRLAPPKKGYQGAKIFGYYGTILPDNITAKTVKQLYDEDRSVGGTIAPEDTANSTNTASSDEIDDF